MPEAEKVKPLDIVTVVTKLLEDGVSLDIVRGAFEKGGLRGDEVDYLIEYISENESNRLINIANQYIEDMKRELDDLVKIISKIE